MSIELNPMTHKDLSSLLHGVLFGYEQVVLKLTGGDYRCVMPYIIEEIEKVISTEKFKLIDPDRSLEENLERLQRYLSTNENLKDITIKRVGEDQVLMDIGECAFAVSGVHETLDLSRGTCPFGIIVAAAVTSLLEDGRYIDIKESEFTEKGSKILMEVR